MSRLTPKGFLRLPRTPRPRRRTAVSLFSGAGLSDLGYELAGFKFHVQVEWDARRAAIGQRNFPDSTWLVADVGAAARRIAAAYRRSTKRPLDLLTATPPCQGLSSSNPSRGKRRTRDGAEAHAEKNRLILAVPPIARALKPRLIVVENVRQILTLPTSHHAEELVVDLFRRELPGYEVFEGVVNVADYGVPQDRRRAVVVAIRKDQPILRRLQALGLAPWPSPTHGEGRAPWVSVRTWLEGVGYQRLEASSERAARGRHALHRVPAYDADRFALVADIPPYTGLSAYHNDRCRRCGHEP
ncbi:MAG: DNA cytosine methyltransferase, partial [Gemmatimonadales bacterium]|nr:DNA cytosine methyltransferase [Gemmatimonadales bacterium]